MKTPLPSRALLGLVPPILVGAAFRLWNLPAQILLDDELHAVRAALAWDLPKILTTYRVADNCIPLTALYHGWASAGFPLTEWSLRLPSLLCGLATPVALPWLLRHELRWRSCLLWAWLLALSPVLVYYGRNSRPYAIVTFLGGLAALAFWRWWRSGRSAWGVGYGVAGAAAAWFHLAAVPFLAAPLGFGAAALGLRRAGARPAARHGGGGPGIDRLALLGALLAGLVAAFLLPAWESLWRLLAAKPGTGGADLESVVSTLKMQAGSAHAAVAVLVWGAAVAGGVLLARERPGLAAFTGLLVGGQWLAVAVVLRPMGIQHPMILDRYLVTVLPFFSLWVARGVDGLAEAAGARLGRLSGAAAAAAVLLLLVAAGPYAADPGLRFGPFAGSHSAIHFTEPSPPAIPPQEVPAIHRWIRRQPEVESVLHAPAATSWPRTVGELALARVHGREVVLASMEERLDDPRLALRTLVPAEAEALLASGADVLLVDREPLRFVLVALDAPQRREPLRDPRLSTAAVELASRLEAEWGEPDLVEGTLSLWHLGRVRRSRAAAAQAPR